MIVPEQCYRRIEVLTKARHLDARPKHEHGAPRGAQTAPQYPPRPTAPVRPPTDARRRDGPLSHRKALVGVALGTPERLHSTRSIAPDDPLLLVLGAKDVRETRRRRFDTDRPMSAEIRTSTLQKLTGCGLCSIVPSLEAKKAFQVTVAAAAAASLAHDWPPDALRGIALYNSRNDRQLIALEAFPDLVEALADMPVVTSLLGRQEATRIALQLIYEYFRAVHEPRVDETAMNDTWANFCAELEKPNWITRGVANLRNFTCELVTLDLGDGVSIRGRDCDELQSLGFAPQVLEYVSSDWRGFGASSLIIVAESEHPKNATEPGNLIYMDTAAVWTKAVRAIGALRLLAAGDVSFGQMWVGRAARFNFGIGGVQSTGVNIPALGTPYVWTDEVRAKYPPLYDELATLERAGYDKAPGNLDLALRAFMATYDRWPPGSDSRLLDSVTALEAVLGSGTEIAFKLAFRVAALLAKNDEERTLLVNTVKGFYDTRSALVHGGRLKEKHQQRLAAVDELRSIVRRLLRAFVGSAAKAGHNYDKAFFKKHLDAALVSSAQRENLRQALELDVS